MPDYIYLIHPYRHELADQPTPEEESILAAHFEYLRKAVDQGVVRLAGRSQDSLFGIIILTADHEAAAQQFMYDDPAVKEDLMAAELHPFRIALTGNLT